MVREISVASLFDADADPGAALLLQLSFTLGWSVVIQPQFDPVQFCAAIERFKVSFAFIVPPVLVVLARHSGIFHVVSGCPH
jgi:hypothetical protein